MGGPLGDDFLIVAVAVERRHGINAAVLGAPDIPGDIAHHHGLFPLRQHPADQMPLVGVQIPIRGAGNRVKIGQQPEIPQYILGGVLGLSRGHGQIYAPLPEAVEQRPDAGVHPVFPPAYGNVALPVEIGGEGGLRLGHAAVADKGIRQGRAQEPAQGILRRNGQAHFLQGVLGAGENPRLRIGQGAVQVKNHSVVQQEKTSFRRSVGCYCITAARLRAREKAHTGGKAPFFPASARSRG